MRTIVRIVALVHIGLTVIAVVAHGAAAAETAGGRAVRCEVREGTVRVEADGASIREIIEKLANTLGFELRGDAPDNGLGITKTLEGSPNELLAKLLQGSNYVLATEEGALKRVTILPAARPDGSMSADQLRKKEGDLVASIAQYEDIAYEALERSRPELARKFERHIKELSKGVEAVRARLPH